MLFYQVRHLKMLYNREERKNMDIRILEDQKTLSIEAAEVFIETAAQAIEARGRFLVALSGGSTPVDLFKLLADKKFRPLVDWQKTLIFWGDERCVSPYDKGSNYRQAMDALLDQVPIPEENILRIKGERGPAEASNSYARALKRYASPPFNWPRFDLVLLGLGADGHTASLFPGSPVNASAPVLPVTANYQDRPAQRVTLTPLVFNAARHLTFLVSGESKSTILAQVLKGDYRPLELPAQRINPTNGELLWLVDRAAASKLVSR